MTRFFAVTLLAAATLMAQRGPQPASAPGAVRTSGNAMGAYDRQVTDPAAADRGRTLYAAECVDCHGPTAHGGETGAKLVRSKVVLKDRAGSAI